MNDSKCLFLILALAGLSPRPFAGEEVAVDFSAEADASRFLARATFGATPEDLEHFLDLGSEAWLAEQIAHRTSELVPEMVGTGCFIELGETNCPNWVAQLVQGHMLRTELWWQRALYAPDQLRQRVAFALSEIFVVSERGSFIFAYPLLLADYHDTLARGAFGTYRDLLEKVTLHPVMGTYLSMVKNQKPNVELGIRPDENFAREVMQLFSIGLEMLNPDGTPILDIDGDPVPSYDQDIVVGMAHAMTGWNFAGTPANSNAAQWMESLGLLGPMEPSPSHHDTNSKVVVTGLEVPAGQSVEEDLELVLDLLANHPNVGPFLGKLLIQRLVTSNPSPAYVARISAVFDDDGNGVRGNLEAVIRAILTDVEALSGFETMPATFGKVREPILRLTALMRAFNAVPQNGLVNLDWAGGALNQGHLDSPSVFNFFLPDFSPIGPIAEADLVAPEMQITTHAFMNLIGNLLSWMINDHYIGSDCEGCVAPLLDYEDAAEMAADPAVLIDYLDALLLGGTLHEDSREAIVEYVASIPLGPKFAQIKEGPSLKPPPGYERLMEALYLLVVSPEFAVQK